MNVEQSTRFLVSRHYSEGTVSPFSGPEAAAFSQEPVTEPTPTLKQRAGELLRTMSSVIIGKKPSV